MCSFNRKYKIYVAGPMRGIPDFNFPAFKEASAKLRALGYDVFSPAERDLKVDGDIFGSKTGDLEEITKKGFSLRAALAADVKFISEQADGIALLPGWENSAGARAEKALAEALQIMVKPIQEWLMENVYEEEPPPHEGEPMHVSQLVSWNEHR
jgi:hypothetical protein